MSDPLSLVSTIWTTGNIIYDYLLTVKNARSEQIQLCGEIQGFLSVLTVVRNRLSTPEARQKDSAFYDAAAMLSIENGPLVQVFCIMGDIVSELDIPVTHTSRVAGAVGREWRAEMLAKVEHLKKKLTWKWTAKSIDEKLCVLQRQTQLIQLSLQVSLTSFYAELLKEFKQLGIQVESIGNNLNDIRDGVRYMTNHQRDSHFQEVIDWISLQDATRQSKNILKKRCKSETPHWFLELREYKEWAAAESGSTLLCTGSAGAGKTMIAAIVAEDLSCSRRDHETLVAHIYCRNSSEDDIYCALLRQILNKQQHIDPDIEELYRSQDKGRVSEIIKTKIESFWEVFLVLDALDEYYGPPADLINDLQSLRTQGSGIIRLLITSRRITLNWSGSQITITAQKADVSAYLRWKMQDRKSHFWRYFHDKVQLHDRIVSTILESMHHLFRLAELQLGYIMSKLTVPDIEDALVHLPANLDESYANVIPRIKSDPVYRDIGMDTMMWLLKLPPRLLPAPVGFIRHCLAASIHGSEFRCEEGLYREENILEACRGLVTLQSDARGLLLDFDHLTIRDYLSRHEGDHFPNAAQRIFKARIEYLASPYGAKCIESKTFGEFLDYCGRHWGLADVALPLDHNLILDRLQKLDAPTRDWVAHFQPSLRLASPCLLHGTEVVVVVDPVPLWPAETDPAVEIAMMLASVGLAEIFRLAIEKIPDDKLPHILNHSVTTKYVNIVRLLFESRPEATSWSDPDAHGRTAVMYAAGSLAENRQAIIELLVEHMGQSQLTAIDLAGMTAQHHAAFQGSEAGLATLNGLMTDFAPETAKDRVLTFAIMGLAEPLKNCRARSQCEYILPTIKSVLSIISRTPNLDGGLDTLLIVRLREQVMHTNQFSWAKRISKHNEIQDLLSSIAQVMANLMANLVVQRLTITIDTPQHQAILEQAHLEDV